MYYGLHLQVLAVVVDNSDEYGRANAPVEDVDVNTRE